MGRWSRAATVTILAFACGERQGPPAPPPVEAPKPEPPAPKPPPAEPDAAEARAANERAELRKKHADLVGRIAGLNRTLEELEERQLRERAGLPKVDTRLRRRFLQYVEDARTAEHKLRRMEQRFQELESVAKRGLTGKLKELTDRREAVEQRRAVIENAWQRALEETRHGKIRESPVKEELYLVRAIKRQWFTVSVPARRGKLTSDKKWKILDGFRKWLDAVPARKKVVAKVLAQPLAPKRKTPDNYDFTDLDFYILLELLEDRLDRQNIAVENRELRENRKKLEQIRKELGTIVQEISDALGEGGNELSEYLDLLERLPTVRENATYLSTRTLEWANIFGAIGEIEERHAKEMEEAQAALTQARKELALVETELRRLR